MNCQTNGRLFVNRITEKLSNSFRDSIVVRKERELRRKAENTVFEKKKTLDEQHMVN